MSIDKLIAATTENYFYLEKFRKGDEDALKYVYAQVYSSSKGVHLEVQKSIGFIKKMIESGRETKAVERPPRATEQYAECMEAMMWQLYKMRYDQKMDFSAIAEKLNLPLAEVVQQYAAAHEIIKSVKQK